MVPDSLLGLISAFFAIVGAAFVDGTASWQDTINVAFSRFLISLFLLRISECDAMVFEIAFSAAFPQRGTSGRPPVECTPHHPAGTASLPEGERAAL